MGLSYFGSRISPNMTKTPEGYLICLNVPIARTGRQEYLAKELQIQDRNPDDIVVVNRTEEEVFNPATIASFEGKPFTNNHPHEDVILSNYDFYQNGHCQNVHRGTGNESQNLVADVYVTNPTAIKDIENGKRQISCGYTCDYIDNGDGTFTQSRIRGNHIALVDEGRAGVNVSIKDSKIPERRIHEMGNTIQEKIKGILHLLARSVKDSKSVDDTENMVCDANESISAIIEPEKKTKEVEVIKETKDSMPDGNTALKNALLTASLALNEAIAYLGNESQPQAPQPAAPQPEVANETDIPEVSDEDETIEEETLSDDTNQEDDDDLRALDELTEELKEKKEEDYEDTEDEPEEDDEEEIESEEVLTEDEDGEVISSEEVVTSDNATKDAMQKLVKDMKPYIASITNDKERARVCDAFVKNIRKVTSDNNSLSKIMNATESYMKQSICDSKPFTAEDQQDMYDRLNPHKK